MAVNEESAPAEPKKKLPIKAAAILLVVLVVEAVAICAVFLIAGAPADVQADGAAEDPEAMGEQPVEILVVADKFPNNLSGRTYLYDTEVVIDVRRKYKDEIEDQINSMRAKITGDVLTIFRSAAPSHLLEPRLSTLTRQIHVALDERLGFDEDGEAYVLDVVIQKCTRFKADQ